MTPELHQRLQVLEQQAEALALQAAALRQQVTALVSEADHSAVVERSEQPASLQFYGQTENTTDASTHPRGPARRSR